MVPTLNVNLLPWVVSHYKMQAMQVGVILTLRNGANDILSGGSNFSICRVHGVKQQPVLVAPFKYQRLAPQDGDTVPLRRVKTIYCTSPKQYSCCYSN